MATAKLVPGKPTVTIEGLSYEAAQAIKWCIHDAIMTPEDHPAVIIEELESLFHSFKDIGFPSRLDKKDLPF